MSRPRRNTELAVRLTAFVTPETLQRMKDRAQSEGRPLGAMIDGVFAEPTLREKLAARRAVGDPTDT